MRTLSEVSAFLNDSVRKVPEHVQRWRDVYYGISLHTTGAAPKFSLPGRTGDVVPPNYFGEEYQQLFDKFLLNRHPRESEITRNWRYSQYRPFTKGPFQQIIEIVTGAIFQDANYGLTLSNADDNAFVWSNAFSGYDLIHLFEWLCQAIFEDPNGYFVRIPRQPYYDTTTQRVEPDVWFVKSKDILDASPDELIFQRKEYIWLVNRQAIFRYHERASSSGVKEWVLADTDGYYAHTFGYLPADPAGGPWNSQGFYDSWLTKAKAVADDFISSKSAEQLVDKEASHPYIVQAQIECPKCDALGEVQVDCDECEGGVELVTCSKCNGSKYISTNPGERLEVPPELMKNKMVDIINPATEINKNHRDKVTALYRDLLEALHLVRVEKAESGVAKAIDQQRLHQFISKISNDLFDRLIHNTIRDVIAYRNVVAVAGTTRPRVYDFTIVKPTQFDIKTAMELLAEYNEGTKAAVPAYLRSRMLLDFVDKQFGGDDLLRRKTALIGQMDAVCAVSADEKQIMVMLGAISMRDCQFSARLPEILDGIVRDKSPDFLISTDYTALREEVNKRFEEMQPTVPLLVTTNNNDAGEGDTGG